MPKGQVKVSPTLGPLLRLVEDYRVCCEIPTQILAQAIGISRLSYYLWLSEKSAPNKHNQRVCKIVGAAMKRAYDNQELPVVRSTSLTREAREDKIRTVLFNYVEAFTTRTTN